MATNPIPSLLDIAQGLSADTYFAPEHLRRLFSDRIARSRAAGKDGIRMDIFEDRLSENIEIIHRKVLAETYEFTTYKERLLLKGARSTPRQISIPTIRDRLVLRAVCQILHDTVPASTGYSPHAVVDRVARTVRSGEGGRALVRVDVRNFFPSVRHALLDQELSRFGLSDVARSLCMKAVSTPTGSSDEPADRGIPQGLSISGALACIYMLRFDERQNQRLGNYFRYVDDILLITEHASAERSLVSVRRALSRIGLSAHPLGTSGKTEISRVEDGIDYLGYHITRDRISVRESSFQRMFRNILKVITDFRYRNDIERLVFRLNLKITGCLVDGKRRGWMMFFSRTDNLNQLSHLDRFVHQQLTRVGVTVEDQRRIKRFVKSYYEICFNLDDTDYIPNFEEYSIDEKVQVVSILLRRSIEEVSAFDIEHLEREFQRLLGQEVHDLEDDVGTPS